MERTLAATAAPARSAEATRVASSGRRWVALDLFRFAAVILMVQGHTFNVLIEEAVRPEKWYRWHGYIHGYTAPMFLFAAGLAFGITTFRRWDDHTRLGRELYKRIERYLTIIAIGYLLHLPRFSFDALTHASEHQMRVFLKVDALQNIGVTLLACELLVFLLAKRERLVAALAVLATAVVLVGPWAWRQPVEAWLPLALVGYVNDHAGSSFPMVPWSGFILVGIVAAYAVHHARPKVGWNGLGKGFATAGSALLALPLLLYTAGIDPFGEHNFWKTGPWFFLWRVGMVMILLALLCGLAAWLGRRTESGHPPGRALPVLQVMGQESLVVYVGHLVVLYGSPAHTGFHHSLGRQLGPGAALLFFFGLFAVMAALAWSWHTLKTRRPSEFGMVRLALLGLVLLYVFTAG